EARKRYEHADIVVDQLNAGWYGLFAIEAMALGKPVVTALNTDAVARTEEAFGIEVPIVKTSKETLVETLRPLVESPEERRRIGEAGRHYVERVHDVERNADRLVEIYDGITTKKGAAALRAPAQTGRIPIFDQITRLGRQSAIYGLGGLVSR